VTTLLKYCKIGPKEVATVEWNGKANRFCQRVFSGEVDPLTTFFTDDAWFYLKDHINTQNKR
jgi:hypothetical protein